MVATYYQNFILIKIQSFLMTDNLRWIGQWLFEWGLLKKWPHLIAKQESQNEKLSDPWAFARWSLSIEKVCNCTGYVGLGYDILDQQIYSSVIFTAFAALRNLNADPFQA